MAFRSYAVAVGRIVATARRDLHLRGAPGSSIDNPAHGVVKFATGRRDRRLAVDEYPILGMALTRADQEDIWQSAIAATRLIITGWRLGEVLGLGLSEGDPRNELPDR